MTALVDYEAGIDQVTAYFCEKLEELSRNGQSIELPTWMQLYAFDIIGQITVRPILSNYF